MFFKVLKYIAVGLIIWILGSVFFGSSANFVKRSEPAQLIVVDIQSKRNEDDRTLYRPVLALEMAQPPRPQYTGNHWVSPLPHAKGEVVAGRYDAKTGEMRTDKMLKSSGRIGQIARIIGVLVAVQSIALIFGVPERWLPLRVQIGPTRRSKRSHWNSFAR